jgi:NADH:ubiquinone oxidoreductase subunit H
VDKMALTTLEAILFILFVIVGSFITVWVYRKVMSGIVYRREEREATRVGRYGKAREKKVRKR